MVLYLDVEDSEGLLEELGDRFVGVFVFKNRGFLKFFFFRGCVINFCRGFCRFLSFFI